MSWRFLSLSVAISAALMGGLVSAALAAESDDASSASEIPEDGASPDSDGFNNESGNPFGEGAADAAREQQSEQNDDAEAGSDADAPGFVEWDLEPGDEGDAVAIADALRNAPRALLDEFVAGTDLDVDVLLGDEPLDADSLQLQFGASEPDQRTSTPGDGGVVFCGEACQWQRLVDSTEVLDVGDVNLVLIGGNCQGAFALYNPFGGRQGVDQVGAGPLGLDVVDVCDMFANPGTSGQVPGEAVAFTRELPVPLPVFEVPGLQGAVTGMQHHVMTTDVDTDFGPFDVAGGELEVVMRPVGWTLTSAPRGGHAPRYFSRPGVNSLGAGPTQPVYWTDKGCHRITQIVRWDAEMTWTETLGPADPGPARVENGTIPLLSTSSQLLNVFELVPVNKIYGSDGRVIYDPNAQRKTQGNGFASDGRPANAGNGTSSGVSIPNHCEGVTLATHADYLAAQKEAAA